MVGLKKKNKNKNQEDAAHGEDESDKVGWQRFEKWITMTAIDLDNDDPEQTKEEEEEAEDALEQVGI